MEGGQGRFCIPSDLEEGDWVIINTGIHSSKPSYQIHPSDSWWCCAFPVVYRFHVSKNPGNSDAKQ